MYGKQKGRKPSPTQNAQLRKSKVQSPGDEMPVMAMVPKMKDGGTVVTDKVLPPLGLENTPAVKKGLGGSAAKVNKDSGYKKGGKKVLTSAKEQPKPMPKGDFAKKGQLPDEFFKKGGKFFIQKAIKKPGQLHEDLGVPKSEPIPAGKLKAAAAKGGKVGQRARFAEVLKGIRGKKK